MQAIRLGDAAIFERNQRILDNPQRHLVFHLLGGEARRPLLDQEAFHLIVGLIARPDDGDIGKGGVADPLLLPVEHPFVTLAARRGRQAAGRPRANFWLRQPEGADLLHPPHDRQPLLLLLLRAAEVDAAHCQAAVDAEERGNRGIYPRHLDGEQAIQHCCLPRAAVAVVGDACDIKRGHLRNQLEGEGGAYPVVIDDRRDLGLHESAHPRQDRLIVLAHRRGDAVEIAGNGWQWPLGMRVSPRRYIWFLDSGCAHPCGSFSTVDVAESEHTISIRHRGGGRPARARAPGASEIRRRRAL